jgi:Uma2 family endonuclease
MSKTPHPTPHTLPPPKNFFSRPYLDNGTRLGWLINRKTREVEIYRQGKAVEILTNPESLSGESILPEFSLDLTAVYTHLLHPK